MAQFTCLCLLLSLAFASVFSQHKKHAWDYSEGPNGPAKWGDSYKYCKADNQRQSPIDLSQNIAIADSTIPALTFTDYDKTLGALNITNNGHSVTISNSEKSIQISNGGLPADYTLLQFHFHWGREDSTGSEHTLNGIHYPLEMHLVHTNNKYDGGHTQEGDGLAVVGVMFKPSDEDNKALDPIINSLGKVVTTGVTSTVSGSFKLDDLMPKDKSVFWRYLGSLTTPPCSEAVVWTVLAQPVPISASQLARFRQLRKEGGGVIGHNYRPVQKLDERAVRIRVPSKQLNSAPAAVVSFLLLPLSLLFLQFL